MPHFDLPAYDNALDAAMYALWVTGNPDTRTAAETAVASLSEEEVREALTEQLASMVEFLSEQGAA